MPRKPTVVRVPIDGREMGGYLSLPSTPTAGALVLIQEIFGVTPAMRAIADDFADEGFAVLVPDIYWRMEPDLDLGNGENEAQRNLAVDYSLRFDENLGASDIGAGINWLSDFLSLTQKPSAVGFCLGGRLAVAVAARFGLTAMVSMYGVKLDKMLAEIGSVQCPMQFHFGENDNHNPLPTIETIKRAVEARNRVEDEFYTYPGAEHAFYNRFRQDRFNPAAHALARERVISFLKQHYRTA